MGKRSLKRDKLAEDLEKDFNWYLTKKAREYYPDTDRLLLMTVFGGSGFKKVYMDPMRRRPGQAQGATVKVAVEQWSVCLRDAHPRAGSANSDRGIGGVSA